MQTVTVQLLLKDRLLQEVPFRTEALSIGRMKENDVVINNLSVSRFHAVLYREDDAFALEDKGSENGTYVNGERIEGRHMITPADEIRVGKHKLLLRTGAGEIARLGGAGAAAGNAWDAAAETYFAGPETLARMEGPSAPGSQFLAADQAILTAAEVDVPTQTRDGAGADPSGDPDPSGDFAIGEDEISLDAEVGEEELEACEIELPPEGAGTAGADVSFESLDPVAGPPADVSEVRSAPEPGEQTSLFAFGTSAELDPDGLDLDALGEPFTEELPAALLSTEPTEERTGGYAGLIVQRHGQLERVLSWDLDELRVGRAAECEVFLGAPEISRRHALFVRDGSRYHVRDLDSINGIYVNGERVQSKTLAVGDVVRIEDFELTFVLDQQPVGREVRTSEPTTEERSSADPFNMTRLHGEVTANPALGIGPSGEEVDLLAAAEPLDVSGFADAVDPEKELALQPDSEAPIEAMAPLPPTALELSAPEARGDTALDLKIVVRREALPEPLRRALEALGPDGLRIPVELCIAPVGEGDDAPGPGRAGSTRPPNR